MNGLTPIYTLPDYISIKAEAARAFTLVDLSFIKDYMKVDGTAEDSLITSLITAGIEKVERICGRSIAQRTMVVSYQGEQDNKRLPYPEVPSITTVKRIDSAGNSSTLATSDYEVIGTASNKKIYVPTRYNLSGQVPETIEVTYLSGWATLAEVPTDLQEIVWQAIASMYSKRDLTMEGKHFNLDKALQEQLFKFKDADMMIL